MNINDALTKEYNRGLADGKASVEQKQAERFIAQIANIQRRLFVLQTIIMVLECTASLKKQIAVHIAEQRWMR